MECRILEELVTEKDIKKKVKNGCDKVKDTSMAILEWGNENKEFLALTIPIVILGVKKLDKHLDINRERKLKERSIYDHSMGMYLVAKKPLTTAQKLDIDAMHKAGMSYKEIGKKLNIKWQ